MVKRPLFQAFDPAHGRELWITDGTAGGTQLVKDINPGTNGSSSQGFTALGNELVFEAFNATNGFELWVTDGTTAGTQLLKDINPGDGPLVPDLLHGLGQHAGVYRPHERQ